MGIHTLALHDLTGFNGRCDAVYITAAGDTPDSDPAALDAMRQRLNWKEIKDTDTVYDLVVVGGGIAGLCTALRSGVSVALIHDRPVLGGCNSSEVRVCMGGMTHLPPYPRLGDVVREIAPVMGTPSTYREEYFEDARKLFAFEVPEGQKALYDLYVNQSVTAVEREGYRVVGDRILTQQDLEEKVPHEDATACITWSMDMHFPEPTNQARFDEAFRSFAYHRGIMEPYPVPYRCLYARDAANLFIGGRLVSASHVAFSAIRVMRTLGQLGEVVGLASVICKKHGCTPRQVYTDHLDELKDLLTRGVFVPNAFDGGVCTTESYHFKDIGCWWLDSAHSEHPEAVEKFEQSVAALGLTHKNPLPEKWH